MSRDGYLPDNVNESDIPGADCDCEDSLCSCLPKWYRRDEWADDRNDADDGLYL